MTLQRDWPAQNELDRLKKSPGSACRDAPLQRQLGLAGMAPGPDTSRPHPEHRTYSYLLRGA
ncbi:MAG: hypothetical protein KJ558_09720 [Gammaproteobacteria bacterium]|nr:hypothetical protein [Gammaproteobacteria bacterium]MBU1655083.1 hypothetical protein [Gammaproteobacteria bacterium]MBU1961555.1 hypothetical protein [Gammaproteobacteria bacterium]